MSDLSEGLDTLRQLDDRLRALQATSLSGRLADIAGHPDLGVGEARAALAEAADALAHQAALGRQIAGLLGVLLLAPPGH